MPTHPTTASYPEAWHGWTTTGSAITEHDPWDTWTTTYTTNTTTSASANTWRVWVAPGTSTGTSTTVWHTWTGTASTAAPTVYAQRQVAVSPEEAARLAAEQAERQAHAAQQAAELKAKQEAAKQKAETLLLAHLTPEQEQAWRENRAIFVTVPSGRRYRIRDGLAHNIQLVDADGQPLEDLCVHISGCPTPDNVLAQKLALLADEDGVRRRANIRPLRPRGVA